MPEPRTGSPRRRTALLGAAAVVAACVVPSTLLATGQSAQAATLSKNVTANLFEYNWNSVAADCTAVLGPDGYAAVQVSPPEDSLDNADHYWWDVYQPVDYSLNSRLGTPAEFQTMVDTCHAAGVKVYVDAVLNHMSATPSSGTGVSYGGQTYDPSTLTYPDYTSADFHSYPANCPESSDGIVNWLSNTEVTQCRLDGLPDLATQTTAVRDTEAAYLNGLIDEGVDGFRLDSAAEVGESDIAAIVALLNKDTTTGAPVFITQEVYPGTSGQDAQLDPAYFEPTGSVTSFDYSYALTDDFEDGDLAALDSFSPTVPSASASSFVTNQDTERASPPTLNYTDGAEYTLADEFLLAYGYGTPQIYSSFDFSSYNQAPPDTAAGYVTNTVCGTGTWECTEQNSAIDALVGWHDLAYTNNDKVANWTTDGDDLVAFSRGSDAWIAINNGSSALTSTFATGLADGSYCDIIHYTYSGGSCSGPAITVSGGTATVTVPAQSSVAFDVDSAITPTASASATPSASSSTTASTVSVTFDEYKTTVWGQNVYLVGSTAQLGSWAPASALPLSSAGYPTWSLTLHLPPNTSFQYKFIVIDGSGDVTWEDGANRTYTTPASGSATINDTWQ